MCITLMVWLWLMVKKAILVKTYHQALIIDDEPDLCELLKVLLADTIPDVKYAHSIESAEKFLTSLKPDVIFLDNNLPDGQGLNYIHEIRKFSPESRLIVITASDISREKVIEQGGDELLEKPLSAANIQKALMAA